ncbi:MAG TPA: hypothetical protein VIX86_01190 [Streptosporangiaceae bacterium]
MRPLRSFAVQSPAIVISVAALVLSLGGGAYAATALHGQQTAPGTTIQAHSSGALASSEVTWHNLPLINGWQSAQAGNLTGDPRWALSEGVVYLSGSLHQPTPGSAIFAVLPASAHPDHWLYMSIHVQNFGAAELVIAPDGTMSVHSSTPADSQSFTSLAGVSFPLDS